MRVLPWILMLYLVQPAFAGDRVKLRFATVVPDGTSWAREIRAMARDLDTQTGGAVELKWVFGGLAGDEMESVTRIRHGQLDATLGSPFCEQFAPSLRVVRLPGLLRSREELGYILGKLRPTLEAEAEQHEFVDLGEAGIGTHVFFTRRPVHNLAELRKQRLWVWDLDSANRAMLQAIGVPVVLLPISEAARAFDQGRIDGFLATPSAALAYQWSTRASYVSDLPVSYLTGCIMISHRAWDALSIAHREALRAAVAKFGARVSDVSFTQDARLLEGLFDKQGLHRIKADAPFREQLAQATFEARSRLSADVIPPGLLAEVVRWLTAFRSAARTPSN